MTTVVDQRGWSEVPDFWDEKNWARPYHFLQTVSKAQDDQPAVPEERPYLTDKVTSGFAYRRAVERSSLTRLAEGSFAGDDLQALLRCLYQALAVEGHFVAGVVTDTVEGWADGYWTVEHEPRHIRNSLVAVDPDQTARMIQGQEWATGPGVMIVLALDWAQVQSANQDVDQAYAAALIACGRIGHALVLEGQHHALRARMTPAVHESTAAGLFRFPEHVSPLYAIRLAKPNG
ncbi:hypothetical protein [Curtobacterium flaccumfaciens]|uniref:hypothetical protein n=1 Tax=Curtobacterium flaccumfaciens TaxID=2035 RepID=UPI0012694239|nr:hypothetical protein [Curtobacterium flaccumfaciens]